jgi:hypothetical protein
LASFQKILSGHTAFDYHIQPHATCTMASLHGTLPYIYVDPSLRILSLFNIYHIQDGEPCNWSSLLDKAIDQQDLCPLVTSITLLIDKHTFLPHPVNYSTRLMREFSCLFCARLTQMETRDDNATCLQVTSSKGTHNVSISPDEPFE